MYKRKKEKKEKKKKRDLRQNSKNRDEEVKRQCQGSFDVSGLQKLCESLKAYHDSNSEVPP